MALCVRKLKKTMSADVMGSRDSAFGRRHLKWSLIFLVGPILLATVVAGQQTPAGAGEDGQHVFFTIQTPNCPPGALGHVSVQGKNQQGESVTWNGESSDGTDVTTVDWWWIGPVTVTYVESGTIHTAKATIPISGDKNNSGNSDLFTVTCGNNAVQAPTPIQVVEGGYKYLLTATAPLTPSPQYGGDSASPGSYFGVGHVSLQNLQTDRTAPVPEAEQGSTDYFLLLLPGKSRATESACGFDVPPTVSLIPIPAFPTAGCVVYTSANEDNSDGPTTIGSDIAPGGTLNFVVRSGPFTDATILNGARLFFWSVGSFIEIPLPSLGATIGSSTGSTQPPSSTSTAPSKRQVVFVHGIRADCSTTGTYQGGKDQGYAPLFDRLASNGVQVLSFCYGDDMAFKDHPSMVSRCFGVTSEGVSRSLQNMTASLDRNVGPLFVQSGLRSIDITKPDDDGPLAYDATKLRDCLEKLVAYNERSSNSPTTITVIGNSMGGAITRGLLTLWSAGNAPGLDGHVTTIFMLEGATEGSWLASVGKGVNSASGVPLVGSIIQGVDSLAGSFGLDPSRQGIVDLAPQSQYYWSVTTDSPPKALNYYSISANLDFSVKVDLLFWSLHTFTLSDDLGGWPGDGIMELGSQDSTTLPDGGGSQFLPYGAGPGSHQWVIQRPSTIDAGQVGLGSPVVPASIVATILNDPFSHFNFGSNTNADQVPKCGSTSGSSSVASLVASVLQRPADACA